MEAGRVCGMFDIEVSVHIENGACGIDGGSGIVVVFFAYGEPVCGGLDGFRRGDLSTNVENGQDCDVVCHFIDRMKMLIYVVRSGQWWYFWHFSDTDQLEFVPGQSHGVFGGASFSEGVVFSIGVVDSDLVPRLFDSVLCWHRRLQLIVRPSKDVHNASDHAQCQWVLTKHLHETIKVCHWNEGPVIYIPVLKPKQSLHSLPVF